MICFFLGIFTAWFILAGALLIFEETHIGECAKLVRRHGFFFGFVAGPAFIPIILVYPFWYLAGLTIRFYRKMKRRNAG